MSEGVKGSYGSIAVMQLSQSLPRGVGPKRPTPEDFVRAGYRAGLEAAAKLDDEKAAYWDGLCNDSIRVEHQSNAKKIRALEADPEAIAAIVARVTEAGQ